jgi:hypothetical protein
MTRPRRRKNAGNLAGFSVVDPGGNWIRIFPAGEASDAKEQGKLATVLDNVAVLGELHAIPLTAEERTQVADALATAADLT